MGPLDGGMVLIGKKFSQYLNSQGDPLLTRLSKGYGRVSFSCKGVHRVSQPENQSRVKLLIYIIKVCQINAPITVYNLNPSKRYVD